MGVLYVTSFCCCLGLEMGARVIGYIHLMASVSMMITCSVFASNARAFIGTVEDDDGLYSTWFWIGVGTALLSAAHVLLAITLLVSVYKRKSVGVRAWVYVMAALMAAALLYVVVSLAARGPRGGGSDIFLAFVEGLLFFGFVAYCLLVVHSFYLMLRSDEEMTAPQKSDY